MADDISHIESQNRGLQLQSANQRALLGELENLLVSFIPTRKHFCWLCLNRCPFAGNHTYSGEGHQNYDTWNIGGRREYRQS